MTSPGRWLAAALTLASWAPAVCLAGDDQLFVADGTCATDPPRPAARTLASGAVIAELKASFTQPGHGLWGCFRNARVVFCSSLERRAVELGLVEIGAAARLADERAWKDLLMMWASSSLLQATDARLARSDLRPAARRRLARLREALRDRLRPARARTSESNQ